MAKESPKTRSVTVRLSQAEVELIEAVKASNEIGTSEAVRLMLADKRQVLAAHLRRKNLQLGQPTQSAAPVVMSPDIRAAFNAAAKAFASLSADLVPIGSNVNQIARAVNSGDSLDPKAAGDLVVALAKLRASVFTVGEQLGRLATTGQG